jgi:hypothetical protein
MNGILGVQVPVHWNLLYMRQPTKPPVIVPV